MDNNKVYIVKKTIPLSPFPLKKGDKIDKTHPLFSMLDVSDSNYFDLYIEPKYQIGQELLYSKDKFVVLLYIVSKINNGSYVLSRQGSSDVTITDKTPNVRIPTRFWFVNSNGKVCTDYDERKGIDKEGLIFKKKSGNYFDNIDDARKHRDFLIID